MVNFVVLIDAATKSIDETAFSSNGCGYMVAAAQSLADEFEGRNLKDLHGADSNEISGLIERRIGQLPESRRQCLNAAIEAFRNAIADHRRSEEHTSELQSPCNLVCRLLL